MQPDRQDELFYTRFYHYRYIPIYSVPIISSSNYPCGFLSNGYILIKKLNNEWGIIIDRQSFSYRQPRFVELKYLEISRNTSENSVTNHLSSNRNLKRPLQNDSDESSYKQFKTGLEKPVLRRSFRDEAQRLRYEYSENACDTDSDSD